jgi:hypothetical protein
MFHGRRSGEVGIIQNALGKERKVAGGATDFGVPIRCPD